MCLKKHEITPLIGSCKQEEKQKTEIYGYSIRISKPEYQFGTNSIIEILLGLIEAGEQKYKNKIDWQLSVLQPNNTQ